MTVAEAIGVDDTIAVELRVTGRVQGVGFRPTVWRIAHALGLRGDVRNDGSGVRIRLAGTADEIAAFELALSANPPALARVDTIERHGSSAVPPSEFTIADSGAGPATTQVAPDAAICPACASEVIDPFARRYRYPFTNCTHCGPRLTIIAGIPYDRATTSMAGFPLCDDCAAEYADPADRRFHAEPIACHACGPRARLIRLDGAATSYDQHSMLDDVDAAGSLIQKGEIVAIKGLGGYQLACDATNPVAAAVLRSRKARDSKPFAMMARDLDVIRAYAIVSTAEAALLSGAEAPIVLLKARADPTASRPLAEEVAPDTHLLGFMLPTTPMHMLMLRRVRFPVVMTSGNRADEPQLTDDGLLAGTLGDIATYALTHDRPILNRVDDSVARVHGDVTRLLRRARGYAPGSLRLPTGFETAPPLTACGGDLKSTFCLLRDGEAVLSPHQGDLAHPAALDDYRRNLALFGELFDHRPAHIVIDRHPEYHSAKLGRQLARADGLGVIGVQHHHAHIAACLAENGYPLAGPPVLGIALDGLGWGDDGTLWGGEFLIADYRTYIRAGCFKPVAMPGGDAAAREPWRNLHAHIEAEMGCANFAMNFGELEVAARLRNKPGAQIQAMITGGINSPLASSCGRLFDAVAAATGICFDRLGHEAQAAVALEALIDEAALRSEHAALDYPFAIPRFRGSNMPYIEPLGMWNAVLGDLVLYTPVGVISARFHRGLAGAIVRMAVQLARRDSQEGAAFDTVALSGGCFQNATLHTLVTTGLRAAGFTVLSHAVVPANDGGLALGQAAIAAATLIGEKPCA